MIGGGPVDDVAFVGGGVVDDAEGLSHSPAPCG